MKKNNINIILTSLLLCLLIVLLLGNKHFNKVPKEPNKYKEITIQNNKNKEDKNKNRDKNQPSSSFTWIDDDGLQLAIDRLLPLAKELDVKLTFAIITSRFGEEKFVSKDAVQEIYNEGFDIIDHGYAHDNDYRPTEMNEEELRKDLTKTKEIWEEMGIPSNHHVIPFGANTPTTEKVYYDYFDSAIMTSITKNDPEEGIGEPNYLPLRNYRIERISYNRSSLEYIKRQIDNAAKNNGWVIIYSHMAVDDYDEVMLV